MSSNYIVDGSAIVNIEWNQEKKKRVQELIANKLHDITHSNDDVLPEYVLVMIQNKKTRAQVIQDLDAFLGEKAKNFAHWLWEMLTIYEKEGKLPEIKLENPTPEASSNYDPEEVLLDDDVSMESETRVQEAPKSQTLSSVVVVQENDFGNRRRRGREYRRRRSPPTQRSREKPAEIRTSNSRLILSAVKEAAESASKAPRKLIEPDSMDVQTAQTDSTESSSSNVHRKPRQYSQETQSNGEQQTNNEEKQDDAIFTVTLSRPPRVNKRKVVDSISEDLNVKKAVIKCAFWPNCAKEDTCPYFHPSESCWNFPQCPFGDKCLYIHPNVPCKYGAACTRPDCSFNHPHPSSSIPQFQGVSATPCRNGFACTRELCHFAHPQTACRFGLNCKKGSSCKFSHAVVCKFGAKCARQGCTFAHSPDLKIPCKFGEKCANKYTCKFYHPEVEAEKMKALADSLPKTPPRENTKEGSLQINLMEDMKED